jgi:hypothetical protein
MVGLRSGDVISLGDIMEITIEDVAILRRTVYGRRIGFAMEDTVPRGRGLGKRGKKGMPSEKDRREARRAVNAGAAQEQRDGHGARKKGKGDERGKPSAQPPAPVHKAKSGKKGKKGKPTHGTALSSAHGRPATRIKTHQSGAGGGKKGGKRKGKPGKRR